VGQAGPNRPPGVPINRQDREQVRKWQPGPPRLKNRRGCKRPAGRPPARFTPSFNVSRSPKYARAARIPGQPSAPRSEALQLCASLPRGTRRTKAARGETRHCLVHEIPRNLNPRRKTPSRIAARFLGPSAPKPGLETGEIIIAKTDQSPALGALLAGARPAPKEAGRALTGRGRPVFFAPPNRPACPRRELTVFDIGKVCPADRGSGPAWPSAEPTPTHGSSAPSLRSVQPSPPRGSLRRPRPLPWAYQNRLAALASAAGTVSPSGFPGPSGPGGRSNA